MNNELLGKYALDELNGIEQLIGSDENLDIVRLLINLAKTELEKQLCPEEKHAPN